MSIKLKKGGKIFIAVLVIVIAVLLKHFWWDKRPQKVAASTAVDKVQLAAIPEEVSLKGTAAVTLPLPSDKETVNGGLKLKWQVMAWNSQFPLMYANGGINTTEGSLFDKAKVQVQIVRQDDCSKTITDFINFANEYKSNPNTPGFVMSFMGDGMPGFSTMLKDLSKLGTEYEPIIIYHMGRSNGEDAFMAPITWKQDAKNALGGTVAGVELDGDNNIVFNWASNNTVVINGKSTTVPINVNPAVYDPNALNIIPATDFLDAANKYITGFTETKKIMIDGKTTGKDTTVGVDAVTTWTPGDVNVAMQKGGLVRLVSTKEYSSQMPNATIVLKKWANDHRTDVVNIIAALGQAGDQVRSFGSAKEFAAKVSAKVYGEEAQGKDYSYWLKYYNGTEEKDKTGTKVQLGGSMAFNLKDASNVFGLGDDKIDRYKVTYETFGNLLSKLYPTRMKDYTPYVKITDKSFLMQAISNNPDLLQGDALTTNYTKDITSEVSSKAYAIQFALNSDDIKSESFKQLDEIFNSAVMAEGLSIGVYGFTDNTGSDDINIPLSERRAKSVATYLIKKGVKADRINVKGYGSAQPITDNGTPIGQAQNRRVQIVLGN